MAARGVKKSTQMATHDRQANNVASDLGELEGNGNPKSSAASLDKQAARRCV